VPGGGRFRWYVGFGQPDARTLALTGQASLQVEALKE
jgi:hypothetical protein